MATRKSVGIKDLKNNLSAYLRKVRGGTRVLVSDRGRVVAEIHEPDVVYSVADEENPILSAWARTGVVTLPTGAKTPTALSPVRLDKGTSARLLDDDRRDRGR